MLADYRDQLLALEKNKMSKKRSVKCLHDEASEFFCARLYPFFWSNRAKTIPTQYVHQLKTLNLPAHSFALWGGLPLICH